MFTFHEFRLGVNKDFSEEMALKKDLKDEYANKKGTTLEQLVAKQISK